MNYLSLVNRAILESGKDMDELTSVNFATPPKGRMYERFKTWVNEAYAQLQMARDEWHFKTGRATVNLYPAVYVENGNRTTAPVAGYIYEGDEQELEFTVVQTITHAGAWDLGTAEATIYFTDEEDQYAVYRFNEPFDELSPTPADNVFVAKGYGRYDFSADGQVTDLLEVLPTTFMIQDTDPDTIGFSPVVFVDWDVWQRSAQYQGNSRGKPEYVTYAPDGKLEFFPRPDKRYQLYFEYTVTDSALSLYDDTPSIIPERYHMAIVWAAVVKAGMFDRDRALTSKAQMEYKFYRDRMEKNLMPGLNFEPSRFDRA